MRTRMLLFACLILFVCNYCNAQTWQWTHPEPNGRNDYTNESDDAHDIETDANGNVYVLGDYLGSLYLSNTFITSGDGSYLAKYDSTGDLLWYKLITNISIATPGFDPRIHATDLTVNANGIFITGVYIPSSGNFDCNNHTVSGTLKVYGIGSYSFTSDYYDVGYFLTKLNANGTVVWNKTATNDRCNNGEGYGSSGIRYNPLVVSDKNNNLITAFIYTQNFSTSQLIIGGASVALSNNNSQMAQLIVVKYNGAGTMQYSNFVGGGYGNSTNTVSDCNSLTKDSNGNIFFYGTAEDNTLFGNQTFTTKDHVNLEGTFIAKMSSGSTWQFVKELANNSFNTLRNTSGGNPELLATDDHNNVYALVNTNNSGTTILGDTVSSDLTAGYLVKLTNAGNLIWKKGFGSISEDLNSIRYANNSLYIAGNIRNQTYLGHPWYFSNLTVKSTSPNANGSLDYLVSKANTDGIFQWVNTFSSDVSMQANSVNVYKDNVYSAGTYRGSIITLGNLNSTYHSTDSYVESPFFGKLKDQYIKVGAIAPTVTCAGSSITIPFTSTGLTLSNNNTFTAELSDANGSFASPVAIGSTASRGSGSIAATLPNSLVSGSRYIVRIKSSDTLATGYNYYAYADTGYQITIACPTPLNLSTTNITATTAKLNWATTSCGVNYSVQIRPKGTTAWKTVTVAGTATSYTATGLTANKAYQWRIATVCQTNPQVLSAYSAIQSFTTASSFIADKMIIPSLEAIAVNVLSVTVSPNPATADAFVSVSGSRGMITLTLTDMSGKTIWQSHTSDNNRIVIPMQNLAPSTYLLSVRDDKQIKTLRVMKAQ